MFVQGKKVVPCRFDWHQTGSQVIISIYAKNSIPELSSVEGNSTLVSRCATSDWLMRSNSEFNNCLFNFDVVHLNTRNSQVTKTNSFIHQCIKQYITTIIYMSDFACFKQCYHPHEESTGLFLLCCEIKLKACAFAGTCC